MIYPRETRRPKQNYLSRVRHGRDLHFRRQPRASPKSKDRQLTSAKSAIRQLSQKQDDDTASRYSTDMNRLHQACRQNQLKETIQIAKGILSENKSYDHSKPISIVFLNDGGRLWIPSLEWVSILFHSSAKDGHSALYHAAQAGHPAMVETIMALWILSRYAVLPRITLPVHEQTDKTLCQRTLHEWFDLVGYPSNFRKAEIRRCIGCHDDIRNITTRRRYHVRGLYMILQRIQREHFCAHHRCSDRRAPLLCFPQSRVIADRFAPCTARNPRKRKPKLAIDNNEDVIDYVRQSYNHLEDRATSFRVNEDTRTACAKSRSRQNGSFSIRSESVFHVENSASTPVEVRELTNAGDANDNEEEVGPVQVLVEAGPSSSPSHHFSSECRHLSDKVPNHSTETHRFSRQDFPYKKALLSNSTMAKP